MKKIILSAFAFAAICIISSCKCHTCTCSALGANYSGKICRNSYNSTADYNKAVQDAENAGCTCKLSN